MPIKIKAFIITVIIMGFLVTGAYFLMSGSKTDNQDQDGSSQTHVPDLKKISDDPVISPAVTFDASAVWYFNLKGQLFRRTMDGTQVTEFALPGLIENFQKADWSRDRTDFIATANPKSGEQKIYYDSETRTYKVLPANIQSFDWLPDNQRIAYIWQAGDKQGQQLVVANADTSGFRVVKDVFWPDLNVKVSPDGKFALLYRVPAQETNKIYLANLQTGEFETVVDIGKNLEARWIADDRFLYSVGENNILSTKIYNLATQASKDLGISSELKQVTVSADASELFAVLVENEDSSIWKINLASGEKTRLYDLGNSLKANNLFLANRMVCFTELVDNKLYCLIP